MQRMPSSFLPPVCSTKSNKSPIHYSSRHEHEDEKRKRSKTASEAALHRRKLNTLRHVFLNGNATCADDDTAASVPSRPPANCDLPQSFNQFKSSYLAKIDENVGVTDRPAVDQLPSPDIVLTYTKPQSVELICTPLLSSSSSYRSIKICKNDPDTNSVHCVNPCKLSTTIENVFLSSASSSSSSSSLSNDDDDDVTKSGENVYIANKQTTSGSCYRITNLDQLKTLSDQCAHNTRHTNTRLSSNNNESLPLGQTKANYANHTHVASNQREATTRVHFQCDWSNSDIKEQQSNCAKKQVHIAAHPSHSMDDLFATIRTSSILSTHSKNRSAHVDKMNYALNRFNSHLSNMDGVLSRLDELNVDLEPVETTVSSLTPSAWSSLCYGDTSLANSKNSINDGKPLGIRLAGLAVDTSGRRTCGVESRHASDDSFSHSVSSPYVNMLSAGTGSSYISTDHLQLSKLSLKKAPIVSKNHCQKSKSQSNCATSDEFDSRRHGGSSNTIESASSRSLSQSSSSSSSSSQSSSPSPSPSARNCINQPTKPNNLQTSTSILSSSSTLSMNTTRLAEDDGSCANLFNALSPPIDKAAACKHNTLNSIKDHRKITQLAQKLTFYLDANREDEARRHLEHLMSRPDTRKQVEALIDLCGNKFRSLLDPQQLGISHESIPSLLNFATSFNDLTSSHSQLNHSKHRLSSGNLSANVTPRRRLHPSIPIADYRHSTVNNNNKSRYMTTNNRSSLSPAYSVRRLVKWPSNSREMKNPPPLPPPPKPIPPVLMKSTILPCDDRMQALDAHALEVTERIHVTFGELIRDLIGELTKDIEIIRTLFCWITLKDVRREDYDSLAPPNSLIGMLRQIKIGCLSRNELFHELCRYAGIHCQYITGYSKGAGYRPGMPIRENMLFRNTWLAVYICDGWRFVNCDWGARHLLENVTNSSSQCPNRLRCDEFYFLTDPEQHVFESFPDAKEWQLLRKPLSIDRFRHLPLLKSPFFNANLALKKNYADCLITKYGQVSIKLKMSQFVGISCSLENSADQTVILGLCLVEIPLEHPDVVRIHAAPSQPGKYYLNIYVSPDWRREDIRELACIFQIQCSEYNYARLVVTGRLPEVGFLGQTPAAQKYGIIMLTDGDASGGRPYIVHHTARSLKLPFAIAPGLKLCHQLKSFDRPGQQMADCDSYALMQMRPKHSPNSVQSKPFGSLANAHYYIRFPTQAFYYLTVYASDALDALTDHLECVYRILIDARKAHSTSIVPAFPRQTFWWVHCHLVEPTVQHLEVDKRVAFRLDCDVRFDSVAVVIHDADWHFLKPSGRNSRFRMLSNSIQMRRWSGHVDVGKCLGRLSVFCHVSKAVRLMRKKDDDERRDQDDDDDDDSNHYIKLLDYVLVQKSK